MSRKSDLRMTASLRPYEEVLRRRAFDVAKRARLAANETAASYRLLLFPSLIGQAPLPGR
jgi:hypothetical protein